MQSRIPAAFAAVIALAPCAHAGDARTIPELFGRLPTLENVVLSPDGSKVAFVKTFEDGRDLLVVGLAEGQSGGGVHVVDVKLREIRWLDEDNLLLTSSSTQPPPFGFTGATRE